MVLLVKLGHRFRSHDARFALRGVLFDDLLELFDNDVSDLGLGLDDLLELCDLLFERLSFLRAFEDIFLVDVAQADVRNELSLNLVDPEPDHQVGDDLGVLLGLTDDLDRLVDIQQDLLQTVQQMQLVLFLVQVEEHAAAHTFRAPGCPLVQQFAHAEHARHAADQHIEVAGEAVHQRGHLHQSCHQLVRIGAALEVDGNFQTG